VYIITIMHPMSVNTKTNYNALLQLLDHVGVVTRILESGELLVRYPNNNLHPFSPEAATKVVRWCVVERMLYSN